MDSPWLLSSSSDPVALSIVDGTGPLSPYGPHYSRRTPGSKTFTGVGQEVVLITSCHRAVWAVVRQKTPAARGSGGSRGRIGEPDSRTRYVWRNMMFRNLGAGLSSHLIRTALDDTYTFWELRYGDLPPERMRTEIDIKAVRSTNPGCCYLKAGWIRERVVGRKLYLLAPAREERR